MMQGEKPSVTELENERRSFLIRAAAVVCGGLVALFPFAAGLGVLIDPWRRGRGSATGDDASGGAEFVRICTLDALPKDGIPQAFPVVTNMSDAWTRAANQRVGMIFLHRAGTEKEPKVIAFGAECPHLGCFVDFNTSDGHYECPCHESAFGKNGEKLFGPSLRGLDELDVKLETNNGQTDVLVAFQRFQKGIAAREATG